MNLLLDTHVLLWALTDDDRLSGKARKLLLDTNNVLYYSTASIWELAIKHSIHPDELDISGFELSVYCDDAGILPLEINDKHIIYLEGIDSDPSRQIHKDPFDRIILAQAKAEGMKLMTHDEVLKRYSDHFVQLV